MGTIDDYPGFIHIVTLICQNPPYIVLCEAERYVPDHVFLLGFRPGQRTDAYTSPMYTLGKFVDALDVGYDYQSAEINVFPGFFFGNGVVWSARAPVAFERFITLLPDSVSESKPREPRRTRLSRIVVAALRELYPWLTDEDLDIGFLRWPSARPRASDGPRDRVVVDPLDDLDSAASEGEMPEEPSAAEVVVAIPVVADIAEALGLIRSDDEMFNADLAGHFVRNPIKGESTMKLAGVVADRVGCFAKVHTRAFRGMYDCPNEKTFSFKKYDGVEAANHLAGEWCRKCEWFYGHHLADHVPGAAPLDFNLAEYAYMDSYDFIVWAVGVNVDSHAFAKIQELRNWVPTTR